MKIDLPTENWADIFGFVPRRQLAELVPQIGNWEFASKAQFFLHEFGEITLSALQISFDGIYKICHDYTCDSFSQPDVPIPTNIKNFKAIHIERDWNLALPVLQELYRNSPLINVHIYFNFRIGYCSAFTHFMTNFLHLIASIDSINILISKDVEVADLLQKEYATSMFASARVLQTEYNIRDDWLCGWLYNAREDGKAKILILLRYRGNSFSPVVELIKKDFMNAKLAVCFFVHFHYFGEARNFEDISLDNIQTGEKMVIKKTTSPYGIIICISRYPMAVNEEWIKQMGTVTDFEKRDIEHFDFPDRNIVIKI